MSAHKMGNRPVSPESATEWLLKLIVWEFFCTFTWSSRARSCARKRRTHVTRWLRYWARTVRPGVADPLGDLAVVIRWERGEIGGLPHTLSSSRKSDSLSNSHGSGSFSGGRLSGLFILRMAF
jgi:uncharacterized membrane protein YgcG